MYAIYKYAICKHIEVIATKNNDRHRELRDSISQMTMDIFTYYVNLFSFLYHINSNISHALNMYKVGVGINVIQI